MCRDRRRILMDASSGILLFKAGLVDGLLDAYRVMITEAVYRELTPCGYAGANYFQIARETGTLTISGDGTLPETMRDHASWLMTIRLGAGESDTIAHYLNGAADFILMDDGKGAGYCREHEIPYINSLLVPRIFYLCRRFSEAEYRKGVSSILEIGRYSAAVRRFGLHCTFDDMIFFYP